MSDEQKKEELMDALAKAGEAWREAERIYDQEAEAVWSKMSHDEQQQMFHCIVKRIAKGELDEGRSYRGVLYDIFGWGPEAYGMGMGCGYLDLHNSIHSFDDKVSMICNTMRKCGFEPDEEQVKDVVFKHDYF